MWRGVGLKLGAKIYDESVATFFKVEMQDTVNN
jgi:hypothetical protein